ncbi:hypothetical protein FRC02_009875 [Tulasnella sp. 418]|nr:hypothetical protein FRC02_009875 [Tulasnella sp. 418]
MNRRVLEILSFSLDNIVREVNFFNDVSKKWGLDIEKWDEREGTRNYLAEMARISTWGSLEDGVLFLWAMEKVYLDAWSFAKSVERAPANDIFDEQRTTSQALDEFISNWTSEGFMAFVKKLEDLTNDLFQGKEGTEAWRRAEMIWERVIELEVGFWPNANEVVTRS